MNLLRTITAPAIALIAATALIQPASGQSFRVAAVVNEDIISTLDLGERVEMIIQSSKMPKTNEVRRQLAPQMLRMLIDEKLKMQEAERLNIVVSPAELNAAIASIEKRNRIPEGQFRNHMEATGVPVESVTDQIRADLSWNKIISRRIAGTVSIDDLEVKETTERLNAITGKPEHNYSEIFLSTSAPADPNEVRQLATKLVEELRNGAPFPDLARQFSQSASASDGGSAGWLTPGEGEPEIESALNRMEPGEVAGPVSMSGGLAIIRLNNRRLVGGTPKVEIDLAQLIVELPQGASEQDAEAARQKATGLASQAASCQQLEQIGQQMASPLSGTLGKLELSEMPTAISSLVGPLGKGQKSRAARTEAGIVIYMVCDREEQKTSISEEQVRNRLRLQRIQLQAERYLQDLRRAAFVEIRL
jgi:peptidyl-prolyl cis-trans isomerase SurA